jgi:Ca-activated chloride channel family protein
MRIRQVLKQRRVPMKKAKQILAGLVLTCLFGIVAGLSGIGAQKSGPDHRFVGLAPLSQPSIAEAVEPEASDKTLSPYFFVKSDNPDLDQLPLKSTSAAVNIAGVIADVKVTQIYRNEGKRAIEAVYIFPASTRAAVCGMKMTIGERTIVARIEKREQARAAYEQAKKEGRSASLLEQQRPNVFQMNVANIMPGDEIRTELSYTELITPTEGVYEFVYPTVVGPRYSNQKEDEAPPPERWVANPYLHEKQQATYSFDITVRLTAGMPVQEIACTSHAVDVRYEDASRAVVSLAVYEKPGGNRDFIMKYRLAGERVESGLLLYQGEEENFFLLMAQPPKRVSAADTPPREYIFIVDVSGSMYGFPLDTSKKLLKDLIGGLRPTDSFNVLLFSAGSQLLAERSLPATQANIGKAINLIEHQRGGGGTELLPALERALTLPRSESTARSVIIITDGYVTVETRAFDLIRKHLGEANFFPFGIGTSVNRFLIEGMARAGSGEPFIVTNPGDAPARAEKFRQYVNSPVLTHIKLDFGEFGAYDVEPASVPDLLAERPVIVFGKWRGKGEGRISIRGVGAHGKYEHTIDVASEKPQASNSALRSLWARSVVGRLSDYNLLQPDDKAISEVTDLGLKYSILTAYTSFVAIDSQVRRKEGDATTVTQPLPLPEGVSDNAVGGAVPPPPSPAARKYSFAPGSARISGLAQSPNVKPSESSAERSASAEKDGLLKEREEKREDAKPGLDESDRRVEIGRLTVSGGLTELDVRRLIEKQSKEIADCLSNSSKAGDLKKITVRWIINKEGKVEEVEVVSGASGLPTLASCVKKQISRWRFSGSRKAKTEVVAVFELEDPTH